MDKSRMTFTFRPPQRKKMDMKPFRDRRPFEFTGTRNRKELPIDRNPSDKRRMKSFWKNGVWLMPMVLAACTGLILGFGILYVFKNTPAPMQQPTVTTVRPLPSATSASATAQSFPGMDLYVYQLGVYSNLDSAAKGMAEFEKLGLKPVVHRADKLQLWAGVAASKAEAQILADRLQQLGVPNYGKDYQITAKKGAIQNVAMKDAATLSSVLTQYVQVIKDGITLANQSSPAKQEADAWNKRIQSVADQAGLARAVFEKANRKEELKLLDDMNQQLIDSGQALTAGKGLLDVQKSLTQSVVDYEQLLAYLLP
ncbi:SPOR domain-containing protein [Effusibacillus dendaii]|uniref:SPOR domain-containing protein n=1 Tax=Effusibacillus dendaii TaxID=2743772 RepID=A0A7I8D4S8_9BACL|nr:hypothetical protein [Effusibacillus dendaii]BCJ85067.1 hypothetical protein skT53_00520 [Effusibacillus dendaii]